MTLSIRNQSPHIPEVYKERIFERLFSLKVGKLPKGNGIGLALSKDIIELHQGSVTVENMAPQGVVFQIKLPQLKEKKKS